MNARECPSDAAAERALFRRLTNGELSAVEFRELEERLLDDAELRARYVQFMELEAALYEAFDAACECVPAAAAEARRPSRRPRWGIAAASLATAATLAAAAVMLVRQGDGDAARPGHGPAGELAENGSGSPARPTQFVEAQLRGLKSVAIVTQVEAATGAAQTTTLKPGMRLKPGVLVVGEGRVQLEFLKGAQVVLLGPAELHLLSVDAATLTSGRAAARVPPSARGFVLNAPDAAIVDLGTEFAVSVDQTGHSEVHVIEGEVEVSLLGDDGNTLTSERLSGSKTVRVSVDSSTLDAVEKPSLLLPSVPERTAAALHVTDEYVGAVLDSAPAAYWRFEHLEEGQVSNEMGPEFPLVLHAAPEADGAIVVADGVVQFSPSAAARCLEPAEAFPWLNVDSFTLEMWVNPDRLHFATLLNVIPEGEVWADYSLNVIEIAHQSGMVHTPGAFRFLHRYPPNRGGGVNLFTPQGCTPGQWHHLVAVKTPTELQLYINGALARQLDGTMGSDQELAYRLVIGQLKPHTVERQFSGALDEFAVYLHPLSAEEINRHYQLLMGPRVEL